MSVYSQDPKTGLSIKTFLPRTLFGRSLMILITPVLLIQIVTSYIFFDRHWSKMTTRLAYAAAGEIAAITRMTEEQGADDPAALQEFYGYMARNLDLQADYAPGKTLGEEQKIGRADPWSSEVAQTLRAELQEKLRQPFLLDIDFDEKWIHVAVQLEEGVLNVTFPGRRLFSSSGYIFLLWMFGISLILLIVAILFMRNQIRPIRKLAIAAERFGKGRDVIAFRPSGAREVRQASQAFLDMHTRIRRQIDQRTAMLAGVSHDLRTPLTRLKLQLEMLGDSPDVDAMKTDIQAMERMIEGYIEFVRGEGDEAPRYTDMNALLEDVVAAARRQGVEVQMQAGEAMNIMVRPLAMERCLSNLVGNAGKYARHVWLSAAMDEKKLSITIDDDGPGIPEDHFEDVFRPFYRVDSSRNTATGGVGLGMPIAREVVHSHGGKIWLEKSERGGLRVRITIPL
ncbi:MAG: HAMP domain-containing protein [Alphaproteobacteria bacterium]|nr:HAMP domain-containing protein [Alphaproteobacteria bacterium]